MWSSSPCSVSAPMASSTRGDAGIDPGGKRDSSAAASSTEEPEPADAVARSKRMVEIENIGLSSRPGVSGGVGAIEVSQHCQ